jgi:DNA-binding NarL/FixJ family response regulator
MKVLIIEDDDLKMTKISDFLKLNYPDFDIKITKSWKSGLKSLVTNVFELTILDMSIPTFDVNCKESGGVFNTFGGEELLKEIKRRSLNTKVIIFTQFEYFGDDDHLESLSDLSTKISDSFPESYIATVFFSAIDNEWELKILLAVNQFLQIRCHND